MEGDAGPSGASSPQPAKNIIIKSPFQRKQDVFDAEDFQPPKFINQIYPDGALRVVPHIDRAALCCVTAAAAPSL